MFCFKGHTFCPQVFALRAHPFALDRPSPLGPACPCPQGLLLLLSHPPVTMSKCQSCGSHLFSFDTHTECPACMPPEHYADALCPICQKLAPTQLQTLSLTREYVVTNKVVITELQASKLLASQLNGDSTQSSYKAVPIAQEVTNSQSSANKTVDPLPLTGSSSRPTQLASQCQSSSKVNHPLPSFLPQEEPSY